MDCLAEPPDHAACAHRGPLAAAYAYLLGLYLGDGMLTAAPRGVWRLRISLDSRYVAIIARATSAIAEVGLRAPGHVHRQGCVEIYSNWKHWRCLFPQHGPGRKHERRISLTDWQREVVAAHPDAFLAGMIHSDGCRSINRVKGREYPRYFFSNESPEIRGLFVDACRTLGVACRPAGRRNVSVAQRASVLALDALVGPKS